MALITVDQYETRYGQATDEDQLSAHIDDVSAEVVDYVNTLDNDSDNPIDADDWDSTTTPAAIIGVVARVVNRALANPFGVTQEGLGDHNITYSMGASGGMLGPKDRRIIRRAVGRLGVNVATLEADLPLDTVEVDEFIL